MDKWTGFFLALGVFTGNFLVYGVVKHDVTRGLAIGVLAAIITAALWYSAHYFRFL